MGDGVWDGRYLSVATVKRDGTRTACPVWCAQVGGQLVFRTFAKATKVRRLNRDARVAVAPCDQAGRLLGPCRDGSAVLLSGGQARRANWQLTRRQGWQKPLADLLYGCRLGKLVVYEIALDDPLAPPACASVLVS